MVKGNTVVLLPAQIADPGDMVAVWLPKLRIMTLKILRYEENRIRLEPRNPDYEPIYIKKASEIRIQGKVIAVQRMHQ